MDEDYALGGPCILSKAPSIDVAMDSLTNPPTPAAAMTSPSPPMQKSESTLMLCETTANSSGCSSNTEVSAFNQKNPRTGRTISVEMVSLLCNPASGIHSQAMQLRF
jgi:hypothetical protein